MQWHPDVQRWSTWDGREWVWASPPPPAGMQPAAQQPAYVGPHTSVTRVKDPMPHTMHLILTILTGGLWGLFVWLPLGLLHNLSRGRKVTTKYR